MQKITLYKYQRVDGGTTVSTVKPECDNTIMYRLVADEGKILTNGETTACCVDTDTVDMWTEIDAPEEDAPEAEEL